MNRTATFPLLILLLSTACESPRPSTNGKEEVVDRYEDGSPRRTLLRDLQTNETIGEVEQYDNEKTFREWSYRKGLKNGESRSFREDGTPWSLNTYVNDTLHGPYMTWHENGAVYIDGAYSKGFRSGNWKFYSPSGELVREVDFDTQERE